MRPAVVFLAIVVAFIVGLVAAPWFAPAVLDPDKAANGEPEEPAQATPWPDQLSRIYGQIDVTSVPAPLVEDSVGGALTRLGDRLLLLTVDGAVHRLREDRSGFDRLDLPLLLDRAAGQALFVRQKDKNAVGAEDLAVRPGPDGGWELFASHTRAHPEESCIGLAVSRIALASEAADFAPRGDWSLLYETTPCLPAPRSLPLQSSGMLAFAPDGRLLMAVGDHGYDDFNRSSPLAKVGKDTNDYGKILAIDPETGAAERLAKGFRNASGLVVDDRGRIWEVEHGPKGGDELNLVEAGADYGWPTVTYGVDYRTNTWPANPAQGRHEGYRRPVYAWVPSIAASALVQLRGDAFPAWQGDLLVGALRGKILMRLRIGEGPRVIVAELLFLGIRVRALAELPDGEIAVLVDNSPTVLVLSPGAVTPAEEKLARVLAPCTECHVLTQGTPPGAAPTLRGVWQREIAAVPGADYSSTLEGMDGGWTRERLAAYLADPSGFAPGTAMPSPGLEDEEIEAVIAALEKLE